MCYTPSFESFQKVHRTSVGISRLDWKRRAQTLSAKSRRKHFGTVRFDPINLGVDTQVQLWKAETLAPLYEPFWVPNRCLHFSRRYSWNSPEGLIMLFSVFENIFLSYPIWVSLLRANWASKKYGISVKYRNIVHTYRKFAFLYPSSYTPNIWYFHFFWVIEVPEFRFFIDVICSEKDS